MKLGLPAVILFLTLLGCTPAAEPLAVQSFRSPVTQEAWSNPYGQGVLLNSEHFSIYTTVTSTGVKEVLPGFMESAYANYSKLTGIGNNGKSGRGKVYLLANRQQWAQLTKDLVHEQPESYLSIQAGGYCYRGTCVFWDIGFFHTLPVAAHEGLHQYLLANLKDSLPMCVEEGLCVMAEGFHLDDNNHITFVPEDAWRHRNDLKLALEKNYWLPLRKLLSMDAGDAIAGTNAQAVSYYSQLYVLMLYIRDNPQYRAGLERMLADARDGKIRQSLDVGAIDYMLLKNDARKYNRRLSEPMFRKYITSDLDQFDRNYTQFARNLLEKPRLAMKQDAQAR